MTVPARLRDAELKELALRVYLEVRSDQESKGVIPRSDRDILSRFHALFEAIGSIQLGLFIACMSILLTYAIVVMILHIDLSRYMGFLYLL